MLVLSRKTKKRICIGDSITLDVVSVHGIRVKLGIACPHGVRILCWELVDREPTTESTPIAIDRIRGAANRELATQRSIGASHA